MSTLLRVLVIEDSKSDFALIQDELQRSGYTPTYGWVATATGVPAALDQENWDLIIVDYLMPNLNEKRILKLLDQRDLDIPVVVVSCNISEDHSVSVIKAGAPDSLAEKHLARLAPTVDRELREAEMRSIKRHTAETLQESEANLLALIENTQDVVWSIDVECRLITFNSNFRKLFFTTFKTRPSKGVNLVTSLPLEYQARWRGYYDRVLEGERFSIEANYPFSRRSIDFEISFNPICTKEGRIKGAAVFGRDITDRKRAEEALHQAKDQLQAVLDAVPGAVSWFSADGTYLGINRYLAATFNLQPEDFIGKKIGFLESSGGLGEFLDRFFESSLKESSVELIAHVRGVPRYYLMVAQKYYQDQAAVFIGIDITDRKQVEEALRESQERYALAVQGANDGLWDWNLRTNEVYFSPRWKTMLGCQEGEVGNSPEEWFSRVHPDDLERLKAQIGLHLDGNVLHFESEHRMLHRDGGDRWMLNRGLAVRDRDGKATRMAGSLTDITDRKRAEEQLLHDALHDTLTGLPNRALLIDRLGQAIERSKRSGNLFAVLFLDLDRFKIVNDSLGHMIGDKLLVQFAQTVQPCLNPRDTVARLGGDEFVILLEDIASVNEATQVAEKIHTSLEIPFNINGHEVFTTASIGIALSETGYDRPEDLLRDADIAMYRAKSLGRARHEVFDTEMYARAVELLMLQNDLRWAVERQEFLVYYQPIVSLVTGQIGGFEALVRWQHPQRGLIPPVQFIPVAEETGLIVSIGAWVLREACHQICRWQREFPSEPPLTISVNLSGRQFSQPGLVQEVTDVLAETNLNPRCLKLEITETVVMENTESVIATLRQLKALGVQLQIDDFGTGYASLSYLHRFPTDTLKIDQSFVRRIGSEDNSLEIVRAIVTLAHSLGMTVTAEGVETEAQMIQLRAILCEYGQGFFFSKAVTREDAALLLHPRR
ncbi:hypothetical protein BST81_05670 [Leptolyngbya sp. 'hensonii']|uniref:EAL domain-containing protein n=1 Tax=Leptolyngbya sp. 'hensonii' TaxID=1922337 RepID=UPI00094F64E8|nr:EAL domain-containing protein [Leptolyngbya sp. 'hensonii']OLP19249.1 hypothetical protein BST81_05670 [Leptolyngbya sp. 'hensonii']